ncbi:MAG: DUF4097 domain-containing protein [Lachnospiraceae bacterium]|jgi:DUF4097 and DUF4098 domain-containing protein YvlB|nr:DUF4097 domain-containing protein [Lachnospiraceae bacterium]
MSKIKGFLYTVVVVAMLGCLSGCNFGWKTNYVYQNGEKYTAGNREITEKIETIDLDYMSGGVKLIGTDEDVVRINETSEKQLDDKRKVHTWVDGTTLYVRYCASAKGLDLNDLKKSLEITIPKDVALGGVKLKVSSGGIQCQDFEAEKMNLSASSGNITLACVAKTVDLHASSGKITLSLQGDSDSVKLDTSSGTINVDMKNANKVDLHSSSGKVFVSAGQIKEFQSKVSSGAGEYHFTQEPEKSEISHSSGTVTLYLPKDADLTGDFTTSSGKVFSEIAFAKKDNDYVCGSGENYMKVHVSAGNIEVKAADEE